MAGLANGQRPIDGSSTGICEMSLPIPDCQLQLLKAQPSAELLPRYQPANDLFEQEQPGRWFSQPSANDNAVITLRPERCRDCVLSGFAEIDQTTCCIKSENAQLFNFARRCSFESVQELSGETF
jgi:hypothetical protein